MKDKQSNENTLKRKSIQSSSSSINKSSETIKRTKTSSKSKPKLQASLKGDTIPLGKFLASNDKATRDRAVTALRTFISNSDQTPDEVFSKVELKDEDWSSSNTSSIDSRLDTLSMAKLYKGLFYCYWMSDKPLIQQQLANELSDLCLVYRPNPLSTTSKSLAQLQITKGGLQFWKGFWVAIRAEWHGIDRHRIDKYLLLCRRFLGSGLRLLQRVDWNKKAIEEWSEILQETVLNVTDPTNPMSLAYHFCDIFLEELDKTLQPVASSSNESEPEVEILPAPINSLLTPFFHGLSKARPGIAIFQKIMETILIPLFENFEAHTSSLDEPYIPSSSTITIFDSFSNKLSLSSNQTSSVVDLKLIRSQVLKSIFQAGAQKDCLEVNRKKLYAFWASKGGTNEDED